MFSVKSLRLGLSALLFSTLAFADAEVTSNRAVFDKYMNNSPVRYLFRSAQWELLNTQADTAFTHFFYDLNQQGYLGGLFDELKEIHNLELQAFSRHAQLNRIAIKSGFTGKFNLLMKIFRDTARDIGFSKQAIDNMEVYVTGGADLNAFTVSGNNNRIIVVLNTALLEKLSLNQVRAVYAHELGHIRSLHSVKGSMHMLLMNFLLGSYTGRLTSGSADYALNAKIQNIWSKNVGGCAHGNHNGMAAHTHFDQVDTPAAMQQQTIMLQALQAIARIPQKAQEELLTHYIQLIINVLMAENGPRQTIQFFVDLLQRDVLNSSLKVDAEQMLRHLTIAQMAMSRAQETGSDNYSTAHMPNEYVAGTMAQLAGIPLDTAGRQHSQEDAAAHREMLKQQVQTYIQTYGNSDVSGDVGTSHPAIALRLFSILMSPSYPQILFADSFLKLLLLEDLISSQESDDLVEKIRIQQDQENIRRDIVNLIKQTGLSRVTNVRFEKLIQYIAFNKASLLEKLSLLNGGPVTEEMQQLANQLLGFASKQSPLLNLVEKALEQELTNAKANKPLIKERITTLRSLKGAKSAEEFRKIQKASLDQRKSARPAAEVARRSLPLADSSPSHPSYAQTCDMLLMQQQMLVRQAQQK